MVQTAPHHNKKSVSPVNIELRVFMLLVRGVSGVGSLNLAKYIINILFMKIYCCSKKENSLAFFAADEGGNRFSACWSNYGSRIDCFAWGNHTVPTGGGDLGKMPLDYNAKYTQRFSGTS